MTRFFSVYTVLIQSQTLCQCVRCVSIFRKSARHNSAPHLKASSSASLSQIKTLNSGTTNAAICPRNTHTHLPGMGFVCLTLCICLSVFVESFSYCTRHSQLRCKNERKDLRNKHIRLYTFWSPINHVK